MKRRLGISVYPNHSCVDLDKAYVKLASEHGFSRVFMSMLEVTESKEKVVEKFSDLIHYAKSLGYETILDVAPELFDDLGISYDDLTFFRDLGADGIRLDVGFNGSKEAMLTYNRENMVIELNMSNDVAYLEHILSYQANKPFLYGCHNFYPQAGTALPYDFFIRCSERFKRQGIRTAAFVSSQVGKIGPWDVNDGLPTLEAHRYLPITTQAKHLFATGLIDDVMIGEAYASEEELKQLGALNRYQLELAVDFVEDVNEVEKKIVLEPQHFRRGDITEQVVRSTMSRIDYGSEANPPHDNDITFQRGDVLVGNDTFGKYKNELHIVLIPHKDSRKNKVGKIVAHELPLLEFLKPWSKFTLIEGKDEGETPD